MPISTSSFGDARDSRYSEYESSDLNEIERMDFDGLTLESAETMLKRLGGGVAEKHHIVEGIGWKAIIEPNANGVTIHFDAHDELLDDLIRRFEEMASRAVSAHFMSKTTIRAGSNIAFIKYWGVDDPHINLPQTSSISMTLADAHTTTTVEWQSAQSNAIRDEIVVDGRELAGEAGARLVRHLDRIRAIAKTEQHAHVVSCNNFPMASGIASSASGFAALSVAACQALELDLDATELSALARLGSGSASRSLFGGFVQWDRGVDHASSVARMLFPPEHWDLCDLVAIVSSGEKKVSSEGGHRIAAASPLNRARVEHVEKLLPTVQIAIANRNLTALGEAIEWDALAMHAVMQTGTPSLLYWQPGTVEILHAVRNWRDEEAFAAYFTIDAGPNVHVICAAHDAPQLQARLSGLPSVERVLVSHPGPAPFAVSDHLF